MSSGGSLPSGTEIGEGGYHGETYSAELEDLANKGLRGTVPPHSRAFSTTPKACYALRTSNGCCKKKHFISLLYQIINKPEFPMKLFNDYYIMFFV